MSLLTATDPIRTRQWLGYSLAVFLSAAALVLRLWLGSALTGFPFITFYAAVVMASFLGGAGPGVLAIAISAGLASWFYMIPDGMFTAQAPAGWIALAFYVSTSGVVVLLMHGVLVGHRMQQRAEFQLRALNDDLESRVAARTRELEAQIHERELAEDKFRQMQKLESVGQLTGGIAHDFNNMLSIIIGSLDMAMRRSDGAGPAMIRNIDNAMDGAQRAATLTRRLLAFSRQQTLSPEVIDANKFVAEICELLRRTLGEGVEIETILAGGLWRTHADAGELSNAVVNLAVNARDAMIGQGRLTIETANGHIDDAYHAANGEAAPGQYVVISVTDTGAGMTDAIKARVFDPFFTTKEAGQGTGLGLSQVYGFVKQSGGHVQIYSEVGTGTTIKLYLPRWIGGAGERRPDDSLIDETFPAPTGKTVLACEDDEGVRRVTVEALRELGYVVLEAATPDAALAYIEAGEHVDVLFTDVVMPGMTGRALAERVLAARPHVRVLYTTGYTRNAIVHNGMLEPGVALLQKPFTVSQLSRRLRDVLAAS